MEEEGQPGESVGVCAPLDTRLNELENQGRPEDPEEAALFRDEIDDIGNEVRKLTSPMKEAI